MNRHRLGGVFDPTDSGEAVARAEWIAGIAVCGAPALHANGVPRQHLVEKAHAALVRNVTFYPGTI